MCPNNDNDKAARRQKALDELKQLVRDQRARLDPALLARIAEKMAPTGAAATPAPAKPAPANSVPYDRAAATRAIELFLATHKDKADFKARLVSFMQKQSH